MEVLALLLGLVPLGLAIGAVLGWIAYRKTQYLESQLKQLRQQIWNLQADKLYEKSGDATANKATADKAVQEPPKSASTASATQSRPPHKAPTRPALARPPNTPSAFSMLWQRLRESWMIWLGGGSIGLAGIFMVRYGIEQGLLGPEARIGMAIVTGLALHGLAEFLRRRSDGPQSALAALAGGASITLFAALLAALHLYQLLSAGLVFALLAAVALLTMLLALRHGPVLAIIGLLGAYGVPVLVASGSNNIAGALVYALIIASAALLLMRYVYRPWLWLGMLAGLVFWGIVSLMSHSADAIQPFYFALAAYLMLAIPDFNFRLQQAETVSGGLWKTLFSPSTRRVPLSVLVLLLLSALSLLQEAFSPAVFFAHLLFVPVLFLAARYREPLQSLPWMSLLVFAVTAVLLGLEESALQFTLQEIKGPAASEFVVCVVFAALGYSLAALWNLGISRHQHLWASLAFLAPPVWLAVAYLRTPNLLADGQWGAGVLLLGGLYVYLATARLRQRQADIPAVWLLLAGHAAYSLAVAIVFQEAGLTLALALQLVSLAWLIRRFGLAELGWLIKAIVALVVVRLTLNPWLLSYSPEVHWSLWTFGGATLCCFVASRLLVQHLSLTRWVEAAALHLMVLTLGAETRYWLYDGEIFSGRYDFTEAAINANLWSALALVYFYRAKFSENLRAVYLPATRILMCLALGSYALLLTSLNPYFGYATVSSQPLLNGLLLAYGLPLFMALLTLRYYEPGFRRLAAAVASLAAVVFINLEIRHLWNGAVDKSLPTSSAELYTYSLVWLIVSVLVVLVGARRGLQSAYKAGMVVLLLVIAKIFTVDMSDLDGLLRVASFMGLGLTLLGMSYLHKHLTVNAIPIQEND